MEKSLKFTININDLKNSNLNTIFGHAGINYSKALIVIENIIKNLKFKVGIFDFICKYNSLTKEFNIFIKNINIIYIIKQFLFFKLLKKNLYKTEKIYLDSILILENKIQILDLKNIKTLYIFYLYFLYFNNFQNLKKSTHFLNLILLKNFLIKLNLKNDLIFLNKNID